MQARLLTRAPAPRVYAVIMDAGDEVAEQMARFAETTGIDGAAFTAIGAISGGTLGFFDPEIADYRGIPITEQAEVVSFAGTITRPGPDDRDDPSNRTVHGHMVVAFSDGSAHGGHLLKAVANPTLEVVVTETPSHLRRTYDPATGLALIDLDASDEPGGTAPD